MSGHCPGCGAYHEEDDNRHCSNCDHKRGVPSTTTDSQTLIDIASNLECLIQNPGYATITQNWQRSAACDLHSIASRLQPSPDAEEVAKRLEEWRNKFIWCWESTDRVELNALIAKVRALATPKAEMPESVNRLLNFAAFRLEEHRVPLWNEIATAVRASFASAPDKPVGIPPIKCECITWARVGGRSEGLLNHHPTCPDRDKYDGVAHFAARVKPALDEWASDEDGIHPKAEKVYDEAKMLASFAPGRTIHVDAAPGFPVGDHGVQTMKIGDEFVRGRLIVTEPKEKPMPSKSPLCDIATELFALTVKSDRQYPDLNPIIDRLVVLEAEYNRKRNPTPNPIAEVDPSKAVTIEPDTIEKIAEDLAKQKEEAIVRAEFKSVVAMRDLGIRLRALSKPQGKPSPGIRTMRVTHGVVFLAEKERNHVCIVVGGLEECKRFIRNAEPDDEGAYELVRLDFGSNERRGT